MKKIYLSLFIVSCILAFAPAKAFADDGCTPIYGGGQTCPPPGNISINKSVQNPQNGIFVDNLTTNDPKYTPGQIVNFKIVVTNTTGTNISTVTINDIFPTYLTYVSGNGSFDSNKNTLTFSLNNLNGGQSQTFNVQAKVVSAESIPFANGVVCVVNQAYGTTSGGQTAQDNSQLCISKTTAVVTTKGGLPVMPAPKIVTTPPTGPEMLPLFALIPTGIAGFILRRRVNK
jgi:uncharacterized repeat protein (TIGR01451 family)